MTFEVHTQNTEYFSRSIASIVCHWKALYWCEQIGDILNYRYKKGYKLGLQVHVRKVKIKLLCFTVSKNREKGLFKDTKPEIKQNAKIYKQIKTKLLQSPGNINN